MCEDQEYETMLKEVNEKVEELQVNSLFIILILFFFF